MAITVPASLARPLRRARCRHAGSEPGVRTPATALNWMVRQTALCNGPCRPGLPWRCSRSRARRRATAVLPQPRSELEHHHTRVKYVFVMGVAAAARILRANMLFMMNLLASKVLMASHVLGLFA